jgi:LCP family protein required for cell wall assembly
MEVVRVDPRNNRISLLSIPRDLWVTIPSTGEQQRINTAYSVSVQDAVDTIQQELGIPINHYVEIDFQGFQDLINTVGGVPMYFDHPVRDRNSGLSIPDKGCVVLDGYQGLAFARSRYLEWKDGDTWVSDPTSDLGRMSRQQTLTRAAMAKVRTMGLDDVGKVKGLVDAARDNVTLDDEIGVSDMLGLTAYFSDMDPDNMQTYSLPVTPHTTDGGAAVVLLDQAAAQPVLDVFRGVSTPAVTTTTAPPVEPDDLVVSVLNGGGKEGEARRVSYVLAEGGFDLGLILSAPEPVERTTVYYAPGGRSSAELVASWLGPEPELVEEDESAPGTVRIELGADFSTVGEPDEAAVEPGPTEDTTPTTTAADATDVPAAPATTTTTTPGWTPGVAPPGVTCS